VRYHPTEDAEARSEIAATASTGVVVVSEEGRKSRDRTALHVVRRKRRERAEFNFDGNRVSADRGFAYNTATETPQKL